MELEQCINNRRSVRKYLNKPILEETIIKLIEAAQKAPSWKNSQVSRYYIINKEETREKIFDCLPDFNKENVKDAPVLIVTTVVKNRSGFERDGSYSTHLKDGFQYFDNGLQVQNLCLKAYELEIGTLIMGIYDEIEVREVLNIPNEQEIVAIIGLGYFDCEPEMPKRREIDTIISFK